MGNGRTARAGTYSRRSAARQVAGALALVLALTVVWVATVPGSVAAAPPPRGSVPTLFVLRGTAEHDDGVLVMRARRIKWFTDRPVRDVGRMTARQLVRGWARWGFVDDPPNAALAAGRVDAVVELSRPRIAGGKLRFDVTPLDGPIRRGALGRVALFVDSTGGASSSLQIDNQSSGATDVALFWTGEQLDPSVLPVVWRTNLVYPGEPQRYQWQDAFEFVWASVDAVLPGAVIEAGARAPGSTAGQGGGPSQYSQRLTVGRGDLTWEDGDGVPAPQPQWLYTIVDPTVPAQGAVGVGVDGDPVAVRPTQPNLLTPWNVGGMRLWVVAGEYEPGEILDPTVVSGAAEVPLPPGGGRVQAVLHADGSWTFTPGS